MKRHVRSGDRRAAALGHGFEVALLSVLVVAIAIANVKMYLMLDRVEIPRTRGLPVTGLFLGVAYLSIRRLRRVLARLRRGRNDVRSG